MQYEVVIFDVGDTLLANVPSNAAVMAERLRAVGYCVSAEVEPLIDRAMNEASYAQIEHERHGAARMGDEDFATMLDQAAIRSVSGEGDIAASAERLRAIPWQAQALCVMDGACALLEALKRRGQRMAIVSNHEKWLPGLLQKKGLAAYFEVLVISKIEGCEKPDTRIMHIACERLHAKASDCLYVGDHPYDVLCAKAAGLDCAWIAQADRALPEDIPYREDYRIRELCELLAVLE